MESLRNFWMRISACKPVRRGLDTLGMSVVPYYLFLEKKSFADLSHSGKHLRGYKTGLLGPEDMALVAAIPGRQVPEPVFQKRLQRGDICCGIKHEGVLVSFVWAAMDAAEAYFGRMPMKPTEAYLFDAFTRVDYRGRGLAPFLRWHLYGELEKRGRVDLYSYSLYSNRPAVRFKRKLNARTIAWGLHIQALNHYHFNLQMGRDAKVGVFASFFRP